MTCCIHMLNLSYRIFFKKTSSMSAKMCIFAVQYPVAAALQCGGRVLAIT